MNIKHLAIGGLAALTILGACGSDNDNDNNTPGDTSDNTVLTPGSTATSVMTSTSG